MQTINQINQSSSISLTLGAAILCFLFSCPVLAEKPGGTEDPISPARHFEFSYGFDIHAIPKGANARIWIPLAVSNGQQTVKIKETQTPHPLKFQKEPEFGNRIGFLELTGNGKPRRVELLYEVSRKESITGKASQFDEEKTLARFRRANRLVPVIGRPQELLSGLAISNNPMETGRQLYDLVLQHMTYGKSKPGFGNGDAVWACDNRTGNCTDFHSLFISLARSRNLPARFEIGFPLGNKASTVKGAGAQDAENPSWQPVRGYHCWAWFRADDNWVPVDISEADKRPDSADYFFGHLGPNRVAFSTGRDIQLVPQSKTGRLNYFIYPHVEVDGQVWDTSKVKLTFKYRDMAP